MMLATLAFLFLLTPAVSSAGIPDIRCHLINECDTSGGGGGGGGGGAPTTGSRVKINPAAVPTEKGYGIETILFKGEGDFSLVRGTGRFGAAISPSNSEETFFGSPGFEFSQYLFERKYNREKFPNNKVTLATAFNILDKSGSGLDNYNLKVGVMGRYNKVSNGTTGGGGLSGSLGAFSFGYSIYNDQSAIEYPVYTGSPMDVVKYQVHTYNLGLFLQSLSLDYSNLKLLVPDFSNNNLYATVHTYTATLSFKKAIFTLSKRVEESPALAYDYDLQTLVTKDIKTEYFGGVRFSATKNIMVGALYNYYLLREYSLTGTLFF